MNANRILSLSRRVLQQLLADRRTLALIFVVPIVVLTVAGILVRLDSGTLHVAVVLEDTGAVLPVGSSTINLGERLVDSLSTLNDQLEITTLSAEEAARQMEDDQLDAIITLPADFTSQTMQRGEIVLPVVFEGSKPQMAVMLDTLLQRAATQAVATVSLSNTSARDLLVTVDATYRYGGPEFDQLDHLAPAFIGMFAFLFVFILTSVAFLRERVAGTLERLQATSITSNEIIVGYMGGYALFALLQALIVLAYTVWGLEIHYNGSLLVVFVVELLLAMMAVNLGIFFSTFARNEFQVVQFIPLVVVTQIFLSGALWPIEQMPGWLQPVAWLMPLTHANYALRDVMIKGFNLIDVIGYVVVLVGIVVGLVILGAQTVHRQSVA